MKEHYTELAYVLSSLIALLVFSASFVIYFLYKEINVYLVALGLVMLCAGVIAKRRLDRFKEN